MVFDLTILLCCQLLGEVVAFATGLPVPGAVLGLVLLVMLLTVLGRAPGTLDGTANGLLQHFSLLFVPAGVGVMLHGARIAAEWPALLAALVVSTVLTMTVTALTMRWCIRRLGLGEEA
jgi:putative effector of murein hydrolase LrgA (UPF0299 family)